MSKTEVKPNNPWEQETSSGSSVVALEEANGQDVAFEATNGQNGDPTGSILIWLGALLIGIGIVAGLIAFSFDVGVDASDFGSSVGSMSTRVENIDKISIREMILSVGGFSFVGGNILLSAGLILKSFQKARVPKLQG